MVFAIVFIFVYVSAAGCIAPLITRNRVGPLPALSPRVGGRIRPRGFHLQRRGASDPCIICAIQSGAKRRNRPSR